MEYHTIEKSSDWTSSYSGTTQESYAVNDDYSKRESKGREKWHNDISIFQGVNYDTVSKFDPVDCIYRSTYAYSVEIKDIEASITNRRYSVSQLYENTKHEAQTRLFREKGLIPLFVRYFSDNTIIFNLANVDFSQYVTVENPPYATDNGKISSRIEGLGQAGILVRCPNWIATKSSMKDRDEKTMKDVWFIPNSFGRRRF